MACASFEPRTTQGVPADIAYGLAVQPGTDGKIVVAGHGTIIDDLQPDGQFAAARYNADGTLDSGSAPDSNASDHFGTGGITTVSARADPWWNDVGSAALVQPDGRILIAGATDMNVPPYLPDGQLDFGLVRLDVDGGLDPGFGEDGRITSAISGTGSREDRVYGLARQPDGMVVVAGAARFAPGEGRISGRSQGTRGTALPTPRSTGTV